MSVNILIQDLYLDYTYNKEVNIERRLVVNLQLDNYEYLSFMSEMNSAFKNNNKLSNIVMLEEDKFSNITRKFKEDLYFIHNDLYSLSKSQAHEIFQKSVISYIESYEPTFWLNYCIKIYKKHNVDFTAILMEKELNNFQKSKEKMKEVWQQFNKDTTLFSLGGSSILAEKIPQKINTFFKEMHYHYLNNKMGKKI